MDTYSIFVYCPFYLWLLHILWLYLKCCYNPVFCWVLRVFLLNYNPITGEIFHSPLFLDNCFLCHTQHFADSDQLWLHPVLPWPQVWDLKVPFPMGSVLPEKQYFWPFCAFPLTHCTSFKTPIKGCTSTQPTAHLEIGAILGFSLVNRLCEVHFLVWQLPRYSRP